MFDEPQEEPTERSFDPDAKAREKADEFRMHAELAAVFEGHRKFDAELITNFNPEIAREIQRTIGRLEKSRSPESPLLPEGSIADATAVLSNAHQLSTNDYHIYRRPGEVMVVRWLIGEQVVTYYDRLQAHFDAALEGFKEDERQANEWKQDANAAAYFKAIDAIEVKMADRYLREAIVSHGLFVLSTQTADEINIAYLCEQVMGVSIGEFVGSASAPPDEPSAKDLAWFYKLFSLRGMIDGTEAMCFFTYLQKSDDSDSW